MTWNVDPDYIDVAERIRLFYEAYPDGRLTTERPWVELVGERVFVCCVAHAYRSADDAVPSTGVAWEPVPGPTPFTKDSELMNAQTSAWGRAIVAAGIPSKKIATAEDVKARTEENPSEDGKRSKDQNSKLYALIGELNKSVLDPPGTAEDWKAYSKSWTFTHTGKSSSTELTKGECGRLIDHLEEFKANIPAAEPF